MSLILKIMGTEDLPDVSPYKTYTLVTDVSKATFCIQRSDDPEKPNFYSVRAYVIEKVKTALVPGFAENEVTFEVPPNVNVYVMNEQGKTISSWTSPGAFGEVGYKTVADLVKPQVGP